MSLNSSSFILQNTEISRYKCMNTMSFKYASLLFFLRTFAILQEAFPLQTILVLHFPFNFCQIGFWKQLYLWSTLIRTLILRCREGRKKQNLKCVRYDVNGECRVLLIANRDISKGERLYYDYNGYEHEYPTEHFV